MVLKSIQVICFRHFCGCLVITVAAKGRFFPSHVTNLRSQRGQIIVEETLLLTMVKYLVK